MGQQQDYVAAPSIAQEQARQSYAGNVMSGRGPGWGTRLDITDTHVGVSPLNVTGAQRGLGVVAHVAGISGYGGVNALINHAKPDPLAIPLSEITSVAPGSGPGLFSPPTARIETTTGPVDVGVTGSIWSRSRSKTALTARDEFIDGLSRRLPGA